MTNDDTTERIAAMLAENMRRKNALHKPYNPVTGRNAYGERITVEMPDAPIPLQYVPKQMLDENPFAKSLAQAGCLDSFILAKLHKKPSFELKEGLWTKWIQIRIRYDFEFWAAMFVKIKDKKSQNDIPFILNRPQQRLLATLEGMRLAGKPIRLIMLKARQWGGSTLIQMYMAWIQLVHRKNWNSIICAHLKDAAAQIKGMYTKLLDNYPAWLLGDNTQPAFRPFEKSSNTSCIANTGSKVTICSSESPEAVRGSDAAMAHLSEAAFWNNTPTHTPENLIRAVCGSIALLPYSVVVIESTANGTGGYFHREYMRACRGESDKTPIFVPWHEIEIYTTHLDDAASFASSLNEYEQQLWQHGATLEAIAWYRAKRREYHEHADMMAEYPSDDIEAFSYSGERVFNLQAIHKLRQHCTVPRYTGEIRAQASTGRDALVNLEFVEEPGGLLHIWEPPEKDPRLRNRYVVAVDIGGRSRKADFSVIAVFDRRDMLTGGIPAIVAQWRGHTDHDLLAWKAVQIAAYYDNALLVVESNTLETECTEEMHSGYILDTIAQNYRNLYARRHAGGEIGNQAPQRWGFHMNRATKLLLINHQINILRQNGYIERDAEACHEYDVFERKPNGSFGAKEGEHDDILITRCIGTYICCEEPLAAVKYHRPSPLIGEASF